MIIQASSTRANNSGQAQDDDNEKAEEKEEKRKGGKRKKKLKLYHEILHLQMERPDHAGIINTCKQCRCSEERMEQKQEQGPRRAQTMLRFSESSLLQRSTACSSILIEGAMTRKRSQDEDGKNKRDDASECHLFLFLFCFFSSIGPSLWCEALSHFASYPDPTAPPPSSSSSSSPSSTSFPSFLPSAFSSFSVFFCLFVSLLLLFAFLFQFDRSLSVV